MFDLITAPVWPAGPGPANALVPSLPIETDTDGRVELPVGHLPVANLHDNGVHEHRGVNRVERAGGPLGHLLEHPVGDPGDGLLGHARAVNLVEVRADLPGCQALRVEGEHHLVDAVEATLPLLDDLRLEATRPIPWHLDLDLATVLGEHRLRSRSVADIAGAGTSGVMLLIPQ